MSEDDWRGSLPHLKQARAEALAGICKLGNEAEKLRDFMERNVTAAENPARQQHIAALSKRIVIIQNELEEIQKSIDELEAHK